MNYNNMDNKKDIAAKFYDNIIIAICVIWTNVPNAAYIVLLMVLHVDISSIRNTHVVIIEEAALLII